MRRLPGEPEPEPEAAPAAGARKRVPCVPEIPSIHSAVNCQGSIESKHENGRNSIRKRNLHVYNRSAKHSLELLAGSHPVVNIPITRSISYTSMNKNIIYSSDSSSNEYLLESSTIYDKQMADNANEKLIEEEALDSNCNVDVTGNYSNIAATESALHQTSKFDSSRNRNLENVERIEQVNVGKSSYVVDRKQATSHDPIKDSLFAKISQNTNHSESTFPSSPTDKSSYNTRIEAKRSISNSKSMNSPVSNEECTIRFGDYTTVSKVTEQSFEENRDFPPENEEIAVTSDKSISRKSSNSIYYFENEEIYHIDEETSFEGSQSLLSSPNQMNSLSFDEDTLIREFELQTLEDRMSVSEYISSEYLYTSDRRASQYISSLANNNDKATEKIEIFKLSEPCPSHVTCSKVSPNLNSLSEEILCRETTLYSDGSDFPETPSTIKADFSLPENLKCAGEWFPVDIYKANMKESVLLRAKEGKSQLKRISHAYSDPALSLSDTTESEPLRKVKSVEKQCDLQLSAEKDLHLQFPPEEVQSASRGHFSASEKTPSSDYNVLTNGLTYFELEKSSGGFFHMETDISSSQLTYTEADVSSKALKVSDQDFSSSSLPYTEADISSIEFPCTEQDVESSVIYTDADTSSNGLLYNEPDDTSSGWPQIDVDTNSTSKLHNEIDTSSYGLSSNEFDASSSVFDTSSSGMPYIECESTNRLSYRTLQSCSSGHDVDSLVSAGSSEINGEEKQVSEPPSEPPLSTNEAPCKDQLKCFPF